MSSASMSSLILFIAAMLIAAGVAGTLVTNVNQVSNSIDRHSGDVRDKIDTEIEIISDPGSEAIYNDSEGTVTVLLKNTGEKTLANDSERLDVVLDGEYVSAESTTMSVYGASTWRSGAVAKLVIDRSLSAGEHRVVIVVNGDREELEFYTG